MAAVALNTFKTIRVGLTTSYVGIYTCPIGVATVILLAHVTNVSSGTTTYKEQLIREVQNQFKITNLLRIMMFQQMIQPI